MSKRVVIPDSMRLASWRSQARSYSTPALVVHVEALRRYVPIGDPSTRELDAEWLAMLEAEAFSRVTQPPLFPPALATGRMPKERIA